MSLLYEVSALSKIQSHPNIMQMVGLMDRGDGKVDGLILPYIPGAPLSKLTSATTSQKETWKKQISQALQFIHSLNILWHDAKTENVLIDTRSDNAILSDFGRGYTKGSMDKALYGTRDGDLQRLERICAFIDELETKDNHNEKSLLNSQEWV